MLISSGALQSPAWHCGNKPQTVSETDDTSKIAWYKDTKRGIRSLALTASIDFVHTQLWLDSLYMLFDQWDAEILIIIIIMDWISAVLYIEPIQPSSDAVVRFSGICLGVLNWRLVAV